NRVALGAAVTKLRGHTGSLPPYVHIGGKLFNSPGVGGNVLGPAYDPVEIPDPLANAANLPQFTLAADVPAERFLRRAALLGAVDRARADLAASLSVDKMDLFHRRAADLLTSPKVRDAFDLSK